MVAHSELPQNDAGHTHGGATRPENLSKQPRYNPEVIAFLCTYYSGPIITPYNIVDLLKSASDDPRFKNEWLTSTLYSS